MGGGESFFRPLAGGFRQTAVHCLPEQVFVLAGLKFQIGRQWGTKFPEAVIEEGRAGFNRGGHAHTIYFKVDEIDHAGLGFEGDELVEGVQLGDWLIG
jgi:hypothetical protein